MKRILQKISKSWAEKHPAEMAHLIDEFSPAEKRVFFQQFDPTELAGVIYFMSPHGVAEVLNEFPPEQVSKILEGIPTKRSFLIFQQLSQEVRQKLDACLTPAVHKQLIKLASYPANSIGLLINPQVMTLNKTDPVRNIIQNIHKVYKTAPDKVFYLYVTDEEYYLLGVVNIRDLLLASPSETVGNIMNPEVISVRAEQDQAEVVPLIKQHNFVALPVVDAEGHFLGVVQQSDILPMMEAEASDDIQKMFGAGEDERVFSSPWYSIRKRLPWLHVNLLTAFIAALVVGLFESTIARFTILAVLLPIVAGQSGNAGAQTLAVVIRGLALREVGRRMFGRLILKELVIGFINGLVIAVVTAVIVFLWQQNLWLALTIGLAMFLGMILAVLTGAMIPIILKSAGHDPAQASSIILTTVTDVVGYGGFLLLAHLFTGLIQPNGSI